MAEPEIIPPSSGALVDPEKVSFLDQPGVQEYLGRSPTELTRPAVAPDIDPRRPPHRVYVYENGREIPNLWGLPTLLT